MTAKIWQSTALSASLILAFASQAWARPECFSSYSFAEAKQKAQAEGKLLLVDAMATWCPPCRKMESTTWVDSAVQDWIKENVIAVQIDVDQNEKEARMLHIEAMPTMVVFTPQGGSAEFGRQVGYLSSSELLQWLKGAKSGKSADEVNREQADAGDPQVWERAVKARNALGAGRYEEALGDYVWTWDHLTESSQYADMRVSLLPSEMKRLSAAYPAAKTKFTEMRDTADKSGNRNDWILLNGILDDNAATLAWFDRAKADAKQKEIILKNTRLLEPLLFSKMRYADAANVLYPDPVAKINEIYHQAEKIKQPRPDTEFAAGFDPFPSMVTLVYGAYLGAGRDAEAKKVADECLRLDNTQGMRETLDGIEKGMRQARAAVAKPVK